MKKNTEKKSNMNKPRMKLVSRIFFIFILLSSIITGIFFSSKFFSDNFKLGSDFKGEYISLVGVNNVNEDKNPDNSPNGNAKDAAKVLNDRLNPIGINEIKIEVAGKNYLKISAPIDLYQNKQEFKNEIQKSGSILIIDKTGADIQWDSSKSNRTALKDYFKSSSFKTIQGSTKKYASIAFDLNGDKFKTTIQEMQKTEDNNQTREGEQDQSPITMVTDVDQFFDNIRNYWQNLKKSNKKEKDKRENISSFFNDVLKPLQTIYKDPETSDITKKILFDYFYGKFQRPTGSNELIDEYGSLIDPRGSTWLENSDKFYEIVDSFSYLKSTSGYVYDSNAVAEDFKNDGKYSEKVKAYQNQDKDTPTLEIDTQDKVFEAVSKTLLDYSFLSNLNEHFLKLFDNYILYSGVPNLNSDSISDNNGTGSSSAYFKDDQFIAVVKTESAAKRGSAIFNSAGKGYYFLVSDIYESFGSITNSSLIASIIAVVIIGLLLLIFVLYLYRILGLFTILIAAITASMMLMFTALLNLTIGLETFAAILTIITVSVELSVSLFESMKWNIYMKKRGFKTSFNIANKETVGSAIDILVAIIIPNVCLFWIGSAALKSFAILITIGSLISAVLSILVARVIYKLIIDTNIFEKHKNLFLMDTNINPNEPALLKIKINNIEAKINNLQGKNKDEKISSLNAKLKVLLEKLETKKQKTKAKLDLQEKKIIEKYKNNISKLETKKLKLDQEKQFGQIKRLDYKIADYKYIIDSSSTLVSDEENYGDLTANLNTISKTKVKLIERSIYNGSKIMAIFIVIIVAISSLVGGLVGINYDQSFGNSTQYTLWGESIINSVDKIYTLQDEEEADAELRNAAKESYDKILEAKGKSDEKMITASSVGTFLKFVIENSKYTDYINNGLITNTSKLSTHLNVLTEYGTNYNFNSQIGVEGKEWVSLNVNTTSTRQSRLIKQMLSTFASKSVDDPNSNDFGFISKRIKPFSSTNLITQLMWVALATLLALIIYILIRFKWTYYIAIIIGSLLSFGITIAITTGFALPFGILSIVALANVLSLGLILSFTIFGRIRTIMENKDISSIHNYFDKEIQLGIKTKDKKHEISKELRLLKKEYKFKLTDKSLLKDKIQEIKLEFKKKKLELIDSYKLEKLNNKKIILEESKKNNYLKEILVSAFKTFFSKSLYIGIIFIVTMILLMVTIPPLFLFGISIIVGYVAIVPTILFITLPLWAFLEQRRIRSKLTTKGFINNLKVSNEEQIIKGIND